MNDSTVSSSTHDPSNRSQGRGVANMSGRGGGAGRARGRPARGRGGAKNSETGPRSTTPACMPEPAKSTSLAPFQNGRCGGRGGGGGRGRGRGGNQNASKNPAVSQPAHFQKPAHGHHGRTRFVEMAKHSTLKGGLGFNSSTTDASKVSLQVQKPRRFGRGERNPQFLVPVKFVKPTGLSETPLEKPLEKTNLDEASATALTKTGQNETKSISTELKESDAQKTFSALQKRKCPAAGPRPAPVPTGRNDKQSNQANILALVGLSEHPATDESLFADLSIGPSTSEISLNGETMTDICAQGEPVAVESSSDFNRLASVLSHPIKDTSSSDHQNAKALPVDSYTSNGDIFFIDAEGDPTNITQASEDHQTSNAVKPLNEKLDDRNQQILNRPLNPISSSNPQSKASHLFRTITDDVDVLSESFRQEASAASINQPRSLKPTLSKKAGQRARKRERQNRARQDRARLDHPNAYGIDPDSGSDIEWGNEGATHLSTSDKKPPSVSRRAQKRALKEKEEMALIEDYMKHSMISDDDVNEDVDHNQSIDALIDRFIKNDYLETFMQGMDRQNKHYKTIDELDQQQQDELDDQLLGGHGWLTDSSSSLDDQIKALNLALSDSDDDSLESELNDVSRFIEDCSDDDIGSSLVDGASTNQYTKAKGTTSKLRAKTKRRKGAIDSSKDLEALELAGGLSDVDLDLVLGSEDNSEDSDMISLLAQEIYGPKKGKERQRKGNSFEDSDEELIEFIDELQAQWKKDRSRKAQQKRARAEARLLNPPKTKKEARKARQRESTTHEPDIIRLDGMIRDFVTYRTDLPSIDLPPLSKKTRAQVHALAHLYGMKSRSVGKGTNRFPILSRTYRTEIIRINKHKHRKILYSRQDPGADGAGDRDEGREKNRRPTGSSGGHNRAPRNLEGTIVGEGVGHIGEDNIGYKLLAKMGWSMGQAIGDPNNSSARQMPLTAVVKNTKGGLGLSSNLDK